MTESEFEKELERLDIFLTPTQKKLLEKFYNRLIETNKIMNLTRITSKEEVYLKHFYDSLSLVKICDFTKATTLCDIGSGAGFPGIVLKICFPQLKITLIDALEKRVSYLNSLIEELDLQDIEAKHIRAEDLQKEGLTFDIVTARAVASLPKLLVWAMPLVNNTGFFIAMKGNVEEELNEAQMLLNKNHWTLAKKINFLLPKEESKRTLLLITKTQSNHEKR